MQNSKKTFSQNLTHKELNNVNAFFSNSVSSEESSTPAIKWLCTYTPEELIIAGGFTPLRITGRKNINKAESYFPINYCPYIKAVWEHILTVNKKADPIIFTNSCDGMRRLFDICRSYGPKIPSYMLDVPRINNKNSFDYFTYNLQNLIKFIEKIKRGKINSSSIKKAIELANNKRRLLKEFSSIYKGLPDLINISTYYRIMILSMTSIPSIFIEDLSRYINFIKEKCPSEESKESLQNSNTPNIMIIGNFINEDKLWSILSSLKCKLAADDLCNSSRYFKEPVEINPHPNSNTNFHLLKSIAYRYMNKPQCMRMANLEAKLEELENNIGNNRIDGVIFITLKFCDNTLYFFPLLKQKLNKLKIPTLYLEIEYNNFSEGQVKTRIQAFLEML